MSHLKLSFENNFKVVFIVHGGICCIYGHLCYGMCDVECVLAMECMHAMECMRAMECMCAIECMCVVEYMCAVECTHVVECM